MSERTGKFAQCIARYLRNVMLALLGRDPYRMELDDLYDRYEKAAGNVRDLQDQYCSALEKWDECQKMLEESDKALKAAAATASCRQLAGMQRLVENLRQRVREKEADMERQGREFSDRMDRMKAGYQERIDGYVREIDRLRNKDKNG